MQNVRPGGIARHRLFRKEQDMDHEEDRFTGERIDYAFIQTALGLTAVAKSEFGIVAVLPGKSHDALSGDLQVMFAGAMLIEDETAFAETRDVIVRALAEPGSKAALALDLRGTPIEKAVWAALMDVPAGSLITYGALARRLPIRATAQEVGAACAANRIAVIVPCHRVVKADGGISGYRWGVWRKRQLINAEDLARPFWKEAPQVASTSVRAD
jgi:AraC family transcriptional regulator of adaptative response/methylated-DNA-[protein]-cysteine methyltransferase